MWKRYWHILPAMLLLLSVPMQAAALEVESGSVYCFSPEDFSEEPLAGICIRELPKTGTVMLGERALQPGDILTADQVAQMTFAPTDTEADASADVRFLPIHSGAVGAETVLSLGIRGKENKPPVAEDSAMETYKNLPNTGKLKVQDPEGQAMTYTVVRQPRRGTVTIGEDGSFTYTPKKNKVGVDSFTYTATDSAGKVSRETTVTITILKPTDAPQYTDTAGRDCCFAAEWMKHTGIFVGETVGERSCFNPDRAVTRGEFVTMLVKTLELPVEKELTFTGYNEEIPGWLKPYLAAAVRSGLTAELEDRETFGAEEMILGGDAAAMLCSALDLNVDTGEELSWRTMALAAAEKCGFDLEENLPLTRAQTAQILYQLNSMRSEAK